MSSRSLTVAVWVVLGSLLLVLDLAARVPGSRMATFGDVVRRAMRTPSGRVGVLAAWLWTGLHFFSR